MGFKKYGGRVAWSKQHELQNGGRLVQECVAQDQLEWHLSIKFSGRRDFVFIENMSIQRQYR
jgi:hypothetical protein